MPTCRSEIKVPRGKTHPPQHAPRQCDAGTGHFQEAPRHAFSLCLRNATPFAVATAYESRAGCLRFSLQSLLMEHLCYSQLDYRPPLSASRPALTRPPFTIGFPARHWGAGQKAWEYLGCTPAHQYLNATGEIARRPSLAGLARSAPRLHVSMEIIALNCCPNLKGPNSSNGRRQRRSPQPRPDQHRSQPPRAKPMPAVRTTLARRQREASMAGRLCTLWQSIDHSCTARHNIRRPAAVLRS